MDRLDTLSSGLLSHTINPQGKLAELIQHFKEYELAVTEIHQYYDLPLVSYIYTDDMFILQIPIYVKHYQQQILEVFSVQTVPVPYHSYRKSSEEKHAYTCVDLSFCCIIIIPSRLSLIQNMLVETKTSFHALLSTSSDLRTT